MKVSIPKYILIIFLSQNLLAQAIQQKEEVNQIAKKYRIPGLSLAYLRENQKLEFISTGIRSADGSQLINENTVFSAASLGKPITAYITLKLVEQGKLHLTKPLSKYYEYKELISKDGYELVTAKMILTHTSGLPNWRNKEPLEFIFLPGSEFSYSGEGFVWLQKVIETIEGRSFEQVAIELVFDPLKMNRTSFVWEDKFEPNFAFPHDDLMFPSQKWKPEKSNAASSLQTTASDYSNFLQELISPQYLSINLRNSMLTKEVTVKSYKGGKEQVFWGLGIGLQETEEGFEMWHWGNNGNVRAFFAVSLTLNKGLVYFTNSKNGLAMTEQLTDMFLGTPQPGYRWNGFKGQGKLYRLKSIFKKKNTHNK